MRFVNCDKGCMGHMKHPSSLTKRGTCHVKEHRPYEGYLTTWATCGIGVHLRGIVMHMWESGPYEGEYATWAM